MYRTGDIVFLRSMAILQQIYMAQNIFIQYFMQVTRISFSLSHSTYRRMKYLLNAESKMTSRL